MDFNICHSCWEWYLYKDTFAMSSVEDNTEVNSALHHTGDMRDKEKKCKDKKYATTCRICEYCTHCSCKCHHKFIPHTRFAKSQDQLELLEKVKAVVGKNILIDSLETKVRLYSLLPRTRQVVVGDKGHTFKKTFHSKLFDGCVVDIRPEAGELLMMPC